MAIEGDPQVRAAAKEHRRLGLENAMNRNKKRAWEIILETKQNGECEIPLESPKDIGIGGKPDWTPGEAQAAAISYQQKALAKLGKVLRVTVVQAASATAMPVNGSTEGHIDPDKSSADFLLIADETSAAKTDTHPPLAKVDTKETPAAKKPDVKKQQGDTSAAAKAIMDKMHGKNRRK